MGHTLNIGWGSGLWQCFSLLDAINHFPALLIIISPYLFIYFVMGGRNKEIEGSEGSSEPGMLQGVSAPASLVDRVVPYCLFFSCFSNALVSKIMEHTFSCLKFCSSCFLFWSPVSWLSAPGCQLTKSSRDLLSRATPQSGFYGLNFLALSSWLHFLFLCFHFTDMDDILQGFAGCHLFSLPFSWSFSSSWLQPCDSSYHLTSLVPQM